jgi:CheY-like chemotaxis protein
MVLERRRQGVGGALITRYLVAEAGPVQRSEAVLETPLHVLLAEDNLVNQMVASKMLESMGATLEVARDGYEVLRALQRGAFDVVLMDCQMPGMDGFVATARIREKERASGGHVPIVAMTANALGGDREHCLAKGMDEYISKPFTRQGLCRILSRFTAGQRPKRERIALAGPLPNAATDGPEVDRDQLREMMDVFEAVPGSYYAELLKPYLLHTQGQLIDLERSLAHKDASAAALIAHTIKGSSRHIGFVGMGDRADVLEAEARQGAVHDPEARVTALNDELRRVGLFALRYRKD